MRNFRAVSWLLRFFLAMVMVSIVVEYVEMCVENYAGMHDIIRTAPSECITPEFAHFISEPPLSSPSDSSSSSWFSGGLGSVLPWKWSMWQYVAAWHAPPRANTVCAEFYRKTNPFHVFLPNPLEAISRSFSKFLFAPISIGLLKTGEGMRGFLDHFSLTERLFWFVLMALVLVLFIVVAAWLFYYMICFSSMRRGSQVASPPPAASLPAPSAQPAPPLLPSQGAVSALLPPVAPAHPQASLPVLLLSHPPPSATSLSHAPPSPSPSLPHSSVVQGKYVLVQSESGLVLAESIVQTHSRAQPSSSDIMMYAASPSAASPSAASLDDTLPVQTSSSSVRCLEATDSIIQSSSARDRPTKS
eukprot:TRINITY_DN4641_c0_g1_i2.p1 TRINITY_DN4641_c0_g1~~TRINITY_DN4641_c0_g1_i2.p1  ORF type:complete len:409 (+),score=84.40 TRINITY_DN4641_c0_g1_i2:152-1228(+)